MQGRSRLPCPAIRSPRWHMHQPGRRTRANWCCAPSTTASLMRCDLARRAWCAVWGDVAARCGRIHGRPHHSPAHHRPTTHPQVDSILIDEARTPLIISGTADKPSDKYYKVGARAGDGLCCVLAVSMLSIELRLCRMMHCGRTLLHPGGAVGGWDREQWLGYDGVAPGHGRRLPRLQARWRARRTTPSTRSSATCCSRRRGTRRQRTCCR